MFHNSSDPPSLTKNQCKILASLALMPCFFSSSVAAVVVELAPPPPIVVVSRSVASDPDLGSAKGPWLWEVLVVVVAGSSDSAVVPRLPELPPVTEKVLDYRMSIFISLVLES